MDFNQAKALIKHVMVNKFSEVLDIDDIKDMVANPLNFSTLFATRDGIAYKSTTGDQVSIKMYARICRTMFCSTSFLLILLKLKLWLILRISTNMINFPIFFIYPFN